ncbi:MAG: invasion associated locus [Devosia sp.]|nr:invasion associated locus [Devosia sp.]
MRINLTLAFALLGVLLTSSVLAQEVPAASTLPGGATSLSEEHGDWTVSCRMEGNGKLCALSQSLSNSQTGERVLSVELATPALDKIEGMLLLPFGMRLADGVALKVDATPLGAGRPFLTCIASGCLVPVAFNASEISAIRAGKELTITGASADAGQPLNLAVSLAGFTVASNRSVELSN